MFHGRISLNSVLLLLLVKFCEWVQVEIDVYIPHWKHQVKPHSSPWFSTACAAAIVHRNHFFYSYQQNISSESKVKFRQTFQYVSERILFSRLQEGLISGSCIKDVRERSTTKNYHPISLLSVVSKVFWPFF